MDKLLNLLRRVGLNRAVGYGVLARIWGLLAAPITLFIIASKFSKEQQGFYYTIGSLLAMQIFFELGLTGVIATFASHEFAKLHWGKDGRINGDPVAKQRFQNLISKSTKWFGIAALLMITILIPAGLIFFGCKNGLTTDFPWQLPWILAVIGTALNLATVPFFSMIMGSGDVATVNHRGMLGAIIGTCISWLVMLTNGGLFAIFAVTFGNIIISWSYLLKYKPEILKMAWHGIFDRETSKKTENTISWWGEIWPLQWKIAVSWISGYFIFQLFNPVLFYYHGSVIAGQMGMTLAASNALLSMSILWMTVKSPDFGKLIAKREWKELDRLFFRVFYQSIGVVVTGAIIGWTLIWLLQRHYQIGQRFLPAPQVALLLASTVINVIIAGLATYLRAHKQEPFMVISVIGGVLNGTTTWLLGMWYSSMGIAAGSLALNLIGWIPAYIIWRRCRKSWHCG